MRLGIEIKTRDESLDKLQRSLENVKKELASVEAYISKLDSDS